MSVFESDSADGAWLIAVDALKEQARQPRQEGRGGSTSELLHVTIHVRDPRQRWVVSRTPALSVAFAIVEVIGILNGRRDSAYLNFFNPRLPKFTGHGSEYHGAYGFRLRGNFGFDQLRRAASALANNPDGRQVVLQIWDPRIDFPNDDGQPVAPDIPCNICSILKVRNGKLEWSQIMRSNDAFKGLPYNLVQFMTLQEVIAGWIGAVPGTYTHFSDSLHLYGEDMERAFASSHITPAKNADSLALPKPEADAIWAEMSRRVDLLVANEVNTKQIVGLARIENAPQAFTNLMSIVAADAARRRENFGAAREAIAMCDNPLLQQIWSRWADRKKLPRTDRGAELHTEAGTA
jgi:thymidylate synthase